MSDSDDIREVVEWLSLYGRTEARTDLLDDILALISHTIDLEVEAREKNAWEGRYNALLEECESSRPRPLAGDVSNPPIGMIIIDGDGDAWQRIDRHFWQCITGAKHAALKPDWGPYTTIYTPKEKS